MSVDAPRTEASLDLSKAEATRRRILDAAACVFTSKGYVATRLTDIAQAARMQAGSLYYHFESKEQIFEEVLDTGMQQIADAVREAVEALGEDADYRERIGAAIEAHLASLLAPGAYSQANIRNFGQIPEDMQQRHMRIRIAYGDYWQALLKAAQEHGAIRGDCNLSILRMLLLGTLNWSAEWYDPEIGPLQGIADELHRLMFDGVGGGKGTDAH
jgi:AcrR family transcriptional regulator